MTIRIGIYQNKNRKQAHVPQASVSGIATHGQETTTTVKKNWSDLNGPAQSPRIIVGTAFKPRKLKILMLGAG
jgi:hypothetical protein